MGAIVQPGAFRTDIEGLRAVAILPILLFHLDPALCPGGFAGVDVFFVISGYLISRMILDQGSEFRFSSFYLSRALRLFPALFATLIATLVAAWTLLSADQYVSLAKSALAAASATSNIYFYAVTDYFAGAATEYPLLHTWSLGVEEQFYLVWPALLVACAHRTRHVEAVIAAAAIVSFAAALLVARADPDLAFYMMPFRIFEFAGGALLAAYRAPLPLGPIARLALGAVAAAVLAASLALFDGETPWPSLYTLAPAGATVLLIAVGSSGFWHELLSTRVLRFFGRISYALYLVHWPVISLMRTKIVVEPTAAELAGAAVASVALAVLLHYAVEQPFRLRQRDQAGGACAALPRLRLGLTGTGLIATVALSAGVIAATGFPGRIKGQRTINGLTFAGNLCDAGKHRCAFGDVHAAGNLVYLVGDSHALNLLYGLDDLFRAHRIKGIALFDHGCLFIKGSTRYIRGRKDETCAANIETAFRHLAGNTWPVIYAGNYRGYVNKIGASDDAQPRPQTSEDYYRWLDEHLGATLESLDPGARTVIVVKQGYDTGIDIAKCAALPTQSLESCRPATMADAMTAAKPADDVIESILSRLPNVVALDPKRVFCAGGACTVRDGEALYFRDAQHLTNEGSKFLVDSLAPALLSRLGPATERADGDSR
jgi:peptidoglycan/LPS O-acetylase OafA/YrhL